MQYIYINKFPKRRSSSHFPFGFKKIKDLLISPSVTTPMEYLCKSSGQRWWIAVSTSYHLILKPTDVFLRTNNQVIRSLALLYDIIAIGSLVIRYEQEAIKAYTENRNVQETFRIHRTNSRSIANAILKQVGLYDWGEVPENIFGENYEFPTSIYKQLGILFYILIETSFELASSMTRENLDGEDSTTIFILEKSHYKMDVIISKLIKLVKCRTLDNCNFVNLVSRKSAQTLIDDLELAMSRGDELDGLVKEKINSWLASWGFPGNNSNNKNMAGCLDIITVSEN